MQFTFLTRILILLLVSILATLSYFSLTNLSPTPEILSPPKTIDTDKDGIIDSKDNCPNLFNPDQRDSDANGKGDLCDPSYRPSYILNHRLKEGSILNITLNPQKKLNRTNRKVLGISFSFPGYGAAGNYPTQPFCGIEGSAPCCGGNTGLACRYGLPFDRRGRYTLNNYPTGNFEAIIRPLNIQMTRFFDIAAYDRWSQANLGQEQPFMLFDAKTALDKIHLLASRLNIPEENIVILVQLYTLPSNRNVIFPTKDFWRELVSYSKSKGYGFKHWEIGNEVYFPLEEERTNFIKNGFFDKNDIPGSVARFAPYFKEVSRTIKSVQPQAKIGISIKGDERSTQQGSWGRAILQETAGFYDFIVGHYYNGGCNKVADNAFEQFVLSQNYAFLQIALEDLQYARQLTANRNRQIYHYDTEWGSHGSRYPWNPQLGTCGTAHDEVRNANLYGTLQRAVRLIYYLREDIMEGAANWYMFTEDPEPPQNGVAWGILTPRDPQYRSMVYWLYYYFNNFLGDWILDIEGTAPFKKEVYTHEGSWGPLKIEGPYTPVLASLSNDGRQIYLIIVNGSENNQNQFRINFVDFPINQVESVLLNDYRLSRDLYSWKNNHPFSRNSADFIKRYSLLSLSSDKKVLNGKLPPHSILFIKATRR
jgi:hypothetical protein